MTTICGHVLEIDEAVPDGIVRMNAQTCHAVMSLYLRLADPVTIVNAEITQENTHGR